MSAPTPESSKTTTFFNVSNKCSSSRARAGRIRLKHGTVDTPVFMPVGTQATMKTLTSKQLETLNLEIILANTYHLAYKPGTEVLDKIGGIHQFMNFNRNVLTDSGGFQMVSLLKFAEFTEEGVNFSYPHDETRKLMLTPEKCMDIQTSINSDIMMQLDDVVVTTSTDRERNELATKRSVRWLDRAYEHLKKYKKISDKVSFVEEVEQQKVGQTGDSETGNIDRIFEKTRKIIEDRPEQVLYPITQGVLDQELREYCLTEYCDVETRAEKIEGGAIGGLSGGEQKDDFCKVILKSTAKLPSYRPRYVMGVGHPIDILVCVALGCDQFDCVWPTRIARTGTALVRDPRREVVLKKEETNPDILKAPLDPTCKCHTCKTYSFAYIQMMNKNKASSVCTMVSVHNIAHHKQFMVEMRQSIIDNKFPEFVKFYLNQVEYYPEWALNAFGKVGIDVVKPEKNERKNDERIDRFFQNPE